MPISKLVDTAFDPYTIFVVCSVYLQQRNQLIEEIPTINIPRNPQTQ